MVKLAALAELPSYSQDWYGVAEQAIGAIYALAKHPDVLCSEVIRRKTRAVFGNPRLMTALDTQSEDQVMREAGAEEIPEASHDASYFPLSQLLFIVGHVASKENHK